ncbi:transposase [Paraburkholderia sp. MM5477-R1]
MTILELHRQGLSVSAIAARLGMDRKTVRKYIRDGVQAPRYGPRAPRACVIDPFVSYATERVHAGRSRSDVRCAACGLTHAGREARVGP